MEIYAFLAQTLVVLVCTYGVYIILNTKAEKPAHRSVAILVLGDMGRSPRMMYHAESWAKSGFMTYLIGYRGSTLIPSLLTMPNFRTMALLEPPRVLQRLPFLIFAPIKIVLQVATIIYTLCSRIPHSPEYIMVQNPPSIPTLALVQLVCKLRGSKLIIDWHNLGYSILAMRLGNEHPLVRIAMKFERNFGQNAFIHLFVTKAMRDRLTKEWDLRGETVVLYDRPPEHFHRASSFEIHELFLNLRMALIASESLRNFLPPSKAPRSTPFTQVGIPENTRYQFTTPFDTTASEEMPRLREDRPALIVSSTSWTADENFDMLLEALRKYEMRAREVNDAVEAQEGGEKAGKQLNLPKVLVIVTGKGPLKEKYMNEVMRLETSEDWQWVRCRSLWLEAAAYPIMLGSADMGICMHSSSSGLDLPMKVVDMFGCELPVCALDFDCLHELVKENQNGLTFTSADQLASQLENLLAGFPHSPNLEELRKSLKRSEKTHKRRSYTLDTESDDWEWCTWADNWDRVLKPRIVRDLERIYFD